MDFVAGKYIKANAGTEAEYSYFLPNKLPRTLDFDDQKIYTLLEEATHNLGKLNAFANLIPDINLFIMMHEVKEATYSNTVEGTQTTLDEAVMDVNDLDPEKRDDWEEVQNYIKAMRYAIGELKKRPLATNLLMDIHSKLLQGVRGKHKNPGEMRRSQNWIGGSSLRDAHFIPPALNEIQSLMSDFDEYINNNNQTPHLIKAAISHYQFETIHPFLDGNGRLGRLIIILYLIENKQLEKPILYISDYISRNRSAYYEALDAVRERNDIEHWIKFFLVAISNSAKDSSQTLQKIIALRESVFEKVSTLGRRSELALKIVNELYKNPIVSLKTVTKTQKISPQTANAIIKELVKLNILEEITGHLRNRIYVFRQYLDLFR
jgi:Fic family protein